MIEITRNGVFVFLKNVPELILSEITKSLEYYKLEYVTRAFSGSRYKKVLVKMWSFVDGQLACYAGYLPRIYGILQKYSIPVSSYKRIDRQDQLEFTLSNIDVSSLRPEQISMLHAIASYDGGQIVAPTGSGKSYICAQICKMYPQSSIVLCAPTIDTVATLHRYLSEMCQEAVGQVGGGKRHGRRITVTTYDSVLNVPHIESVDILIVDECHRSASPEYAKLFTAISSPLKRFGLTATPVGRSDHAEWMVEGLFGPIVVNISYQQSVQSGSIIPIHVLACVQPHGPSPQMLDECDDQACKDRLAIWLNFERNKKIAMDVTALRKHWYTDDPQTLILVDKVEHLCALHALLPDYEVVFGSADTEKLEKLRDLGVVSEDRFESYKNIDRHEVRRRFETGEARKIIATSIFATGVSSNECAIVAIASGTGSTISFLQGLGRGSRKSESKPFAVCMIWKDVFHVTYNRRSQKLLSAACQQKHPVHMIHRTEDLVLWAQKLKTMCNI